MDQTVWQDIRTLLQASKSLGLPDAYSQHYRIQLDNRADMGHDSALVSGRIMLGWVGNNLASQDTVLVKLRLSDSYSVAKHASEFASSTL